VFCTWLVAIASAWPLFMEVHFTHDACQNVDKSSWNEPDFELIDPVEKYSVEIF
jgi:hypothetical protein